MESKCNETFCGFFGKEDIQWAGEAPGGGAPRGAQPTRARLGAQASPGGFCPPRVLLEPPLCSTNTPIFQKP